MDRLGYIEGYLARLISSAGRSPIVAISGVGDEGRLSVFPKDDLGAPVLVAQWNFVTQGQAVRAAFEERGVPRIKGNVPYWKAKRSLKL